MWPPKFESRITAIGAAIAINKPHEDYPLRVKTTRCLIEEFDSMHLNITERLIKSVHSHVMCERKGRGFYRSYNVRVGTYIPPDHLQVRDLMEVFLPRSIWKLSDLENFYIKFEEIHPFSDGNGRVGGIIIAGLSYILTGKYMVSGV
jgi:hypothetical protein